MKIINLWQFIILAALALTPLAAQDTSTEDLVEEGANLLDDPRLKNMFRQVQEDPEKAATNAIQELKANSDKADNAVREATRVFQDNQKEIEGAAQAIQENRSTLPLKPWADRNSAGWLRPPLKQRSPPQPRPGQTLPQRARLEA